MAKKDANDTRRGNQRVTNLSERRLAQRQAGDKPKCGSPLASSRKEGHPNFGRTCRLPAGAGTDHPGYGTCSRHAGSMPAGKVVAARERVAEVMDKKRREYAFYGIPIKVGYEEAHLEELWRSVAIVRWIESKLATWGDTGDGGKGQWDSEDTGLPPLLQEHWGRVAVTISDTEYAAWLRQYLLERKHLAAVAADGIKSGIAKQVVQIYQQQADMMNRIIRRALGELGLDPDDDRLPQILPRVTREVAAEFQAS